MGPGLLGCPQPSLFSGPCPYNALSSFRLCAFVYPSLTLTTAQALYRLSLSSLYTCKGGIGILHTRLLKNREVRCLLGSHSQEMTVKIQKQVS